MKHVSDDFEMRYELSPPLQSLLMLMFSIVLARIKICGTKLILFTLDEVHQAVPITPATENSSYSKERLLRL